MPKLKTLPADLQNREIVAKIQYGMTKRQVTHEELALAARMTKQTLYHRYKCPDGFRLGELRRVAKKLNIPLQKLLFDETSEKCKDCKIEGYGKINAIH
jgi:hypothetical protein